MMRMGDGNSWMLSVVFKKFCWLFVWYLWMVFSVDIYI